MQNQLVPPWPRVITYKHLSGYIACLQLSFVTLSECICSLSHLLRNIAATRDLGVMLCSSYCLVPMTLWGTHHFRLMPVCWASCGSGSSPVRRHYLLADHPSNHEGRHNCPRKTYYTRRASTSTERLVSMIEQGIPLASVLNIVSLRDVTADYFAIWAD